MDGSRFDALVGRLTESSSRRRALGVLGLSALVAGGLQAVPDAEAGRGRKHGKGKRGKGKGKGNGGNGGTTPQPTANRQLRQACSPGVDICASPSTCGVPTGDHRCSSTIDEWIGEDGTNLCCVPPGGSCQACECCGNFECRLGVGNTGTCQQMN